MYVIEDSASIDTNPWHAYVSEPDHQLMVHMVEKEKAMRFKTIKDAKTFLNIYKWRMDDFNFQRIKDLEIKEG